MTVKDKNGLGTVALKEVGDKTEFTLTFTNNGKQDASYQFNDYGGVLHEAQDDSGLKYDEYLKNASITTNQNQFTVPANSSLDVTFTLDVTGSKANQFVEGFLGFTPVNSESGLVDLNVPYAGFYGDYANLPVFDQPAWHKDQNGDYDSIFGGQFFYDYDSSIPSGLDLGLNELNSLYSSGTFSGNIADLAKYIDPSHVAFSPNGDDDWDAVIPNIYLLRNVSSLNIDILDSKGNVVRELNKDNGYTKTWSTEDGSQVNYITVSSTWDGKISDPATGQTKVAPDGTYTYRVTATPDYPDAKPQTLDLSVIVDTTKPVIKNLGLQKDSNGDVYVTGSATDATSGFSDLTYMSFSINGVLSAYDLTDLTPEDRIGLGDKTQATTKIDPSNFKIKLNAKQAAAVKNGANDVQASIFDNAHNFSASQEKVSLGQADDMNNGLIVYNVSNYEEETDVTSPYYDPKNKTYSIQGYFPRDFYISSDGKNFTKVNVDEIGSFIANVPVSDETKKLYFTLDPNLQRPIQEFNFAFNLVPTITLDKEASGLDDDNTRVVDYDENEDGTVTFKGTYSDDSFDVSLQSYNENNDSDWVDQTSKVVKDPAAHTWSATITPETGTNQYNIFAIKKGGINGQTLIPSQPELAVVYKYDDTYLRWDNIADEGTSYVTSSGDDDFNKEANTYTVRGKLDPNDAKDLVIYGYSQDPNDPRNKPVVNADGSFTYDVPLGLATNADGTSFNDTSVSNNNLKIKYDFSQKLTDGTFATNTSMFALYVDSQDPSVNFNIGDQWSTSDDGTSYDVYTNQPTFNLQGTANDNLDGYSLRINSDVVLRTAGAAWDNSFLVENMASADFDHQFALDTSKDKTDNTFNVTVVDKMGNKVTKTIRVHYSVAKAASPIVAQDITTPTNKSVNVSAKVANPDDILSYSLDGTTFVPYLSDVSLPSNGTVYFKETDKFGNDSEIVKHDVTNIYKAVASQAKVVSDKQVADSNKHQLQLGLNDDISDLEKSITSIEYSLDNGKTWKQYTGALELDAPVNLQYRSKDTAGNAGEVQNYVIEKHTITPVKITASLDSYKLEVGKTAKITTNITPTYASNDQLSFSSSDNNVVDVDLNGKVTAKNPGKATITITDKLAGVFDTLTITVLSDVNDFTSSFVLPKTILNTNGSSSATGNLDSWLSNKNSSTTSANGQSLISVTTKDKTQANTPAVLATTNSNQSNKELPKTGENTELINELELAGDLAFFLLVLFILAGYKKNKLKQFSSLTLSFIAFNLYSPALSNLAENIGKLESPTVSLNKQLAKKSFGPNLVDAKAVGFVGGIKDLTDNKANLLSLDYSSTIVEVGNQSDEVKTAAQSVLTQIIGTLNYGMTVVDNHPQSYSQLLTPEQIDTLIEQFRQELSQETSADGVYSLQTEFFSNGGPVDLLVKKTVASQNDPVNLRNKALASFNDYINSPSFDSIDRATKDQWVADLTSTLSTLDSQSDIAKALNDARTKASDVLQALQHDKNVASLAEYKENKIKQLSKILDSSNLSDQQKTELLNQATSAINAVTLNVYDDFDQAKVDVDTAYNDAIDQINKALFENQYPITIDKNTIPDENLRNEILYQMQLGNDGVPTNKLTYDFAGQFTSLTLKKSLNIENYEGLQYFFNLTNLDISGSDVQDWSPLSKLPKLQSITADILGNDVTDIDVSDFPALTSLQISGNHSDGNDILSGSTAVKSVKTNANLDQLILYNLPNLDTVNTSLSTELTYLSASKLPELTNLDLSQNDNLVSLYAYNDENLSKLDVSNLYQLETLSLFGDALTSEGFEIGNIGYNLRTLNLNNNSGLNELPNDLYNLQSLAISGTAISDVSNTLKQAGSNLLNFTASDIPELTSVDLSNNKNLQSIALSNDSLTELNLQVTDENGNKIPLMPNLSVAILSGNQLSQLDFSNYQSLSFVQADNNQLTDLLVNGDTNLSVLTASNNKLVNIDLADNIYLSGYDLSGNNLTTLDLTTNIAINHQFGNSTYQTTDSKMYEVDGQYYVNLTDVVGKDNIKFVDVPGAGYAGNYQIIDNNDWEYNTVTGIAKWVGTGTPSQIQYLFSAGSSQFMPVIVDLNNDSNRTFNLSFDVVDTNAGSIDADQQTVQLGSPANSIPKPVAKAGFVFDHFENSHGITIDPNISKPNQDETYYAIFANADAENKPVREAEDTQVISVVVNDDNTVTIIGNTNLATNLIFDQNENPVTVDENGNFTYTVSADDNKESLTFTTWNYTQTRSKDKTITWENPFPASKPTETPTDDKPVVPVYENRSINVTDLETQTFTHTTHFVDQNGQKAGEDLVEKVVYTRSKTIDQDGNIVYGNWVDANGKTLTTDSNWEQTKVVEKKNNDEITNQNSIPNEENKESTTNASKTNENLELGTTTNKKAVELPKTGRTQQLSFNIAFIALAFTIFIESTKEKKTKKNK
ncbi:MAG: Fn3-like domain-containing protein [Lactobacillaceae bacterium]|nr:Fn3-like domain-containing protein [Lactobacillaceae bacterium]